MDWWQALLLGIVQGLTEFLPVSSSGHLVVARELLSVDPEGFLDFTVAVHLATVLSTLVVFRAEIAQLLKGFFRFRYNDQTDYVCKILVSMVPVAVVGFFFKDGIEYLFGAGTGIVPWCLVVTALLLFLSEIIGRARAATARPHRNGISYPQAVVMGFAQALAVLPGLSRSGTTIAAGLMSGARRDEIARFSFLMVLIPIVGEQGLNLVKSFSAGTVSGPGVGVPALVTGFAAAFASGLFACRVMINLVSRVKLGWFALYCLVLAALLFVFA